MTCIHRQALASIAAALLSLLLGGCDIAGLGHNQIVSGTVSLSLGKADASNAQTLVCYWVVGRVDVFANGEEVGTESFDIQNDPRVTTVTIPVEVPEGPTLFSASAFTIRDRLVFEGETDGLVNVGQDDPPAVIDLFAVAPALEFCFDYESGFGSVTNRGAANLNWLASSLDECDNGVDCVFPSPEGGTLGSGETDNVFFERVIGPNEYTCLGVTDGFHELRIPICFGNPDLQTGCDPPEEPDC